MKKFLREFRTFITKGNVMDLAVGVIIGAAFKDIVTSLTDNIISPILGIFGSVDFSDLKITLGKKVLEDGTVITNTLNYGAFITSVINFIIMAFIIFLMVKAVNKIESISEHLGDKFKKDETEAVTVPTTKICPFCKSEIDITATRCPHCTSVLEDSAEK